MDMAISERAGVRGDRRKISPSAISENQLEKPWHAARERDFDLGS